MAEEILEIVNFPETVSENDEISVIYATPVSIKKGTSRFDAIPVEDYTRRSKRAIDLSQDSSYFDDEVQVLRSLPKYCKRVFQGETSNSKSAKGAESGIPKTFTCEICTDEKPWDGSFRVLGCNHFYCSQCVVKYVASKLQENITNINCPVVGCNGFLEPQHCQSILPKQVFDRWGDALCEAVILASEKVYCPFKDCSALLIDDRGGSEVMVQSECPDCGRLFCAQCKVPWHSGVECVEFQKLKENERSCEDLMLMNLAKKEKWMRCFNCKYYVEKSEGCLYMTCRCGHAFCYKCGSPLRQHYCHNCRS